jgi:RNase adaptor protein for sRNA GlmZ degradation
MKEIKNKLEKLFEYWADDKALEIMDLVQSGSNRKYFRIIGKEKTAIGVFNKDKKENIAFISFTNHFLKKGLNVPELFAQKLNENIYLIEDLGNTTLFSLVEKAKQSGQISEKILEYFKIALTELIRFQINGKKGLDFTVCYPRKTFDMQSIMWDLNYFKYYFLRLTKIPFDEQKLEEDFHCFSEYLLSAESKYFMYRDFQSRNILVNNNQLYFIDYQGGRKGALQYDVASLLFQAKINLSPDIRNSLLEFYVNELHQKSKIKNQVFLKHYYGYVLIRLLQTLGAYGFRGYYENRTHFLLSIPYALKNLEWLTNNNHLPKRLSELNRVITSILKNETVKNLELKSPGEKLKITINSFSYKEGIPKDFTGNGGGFVFDCRSLENPGRYPEYSHSTGLDENVINFLNDRNDVKDFLNSVYSIVDESVNKYLKRDFKNLMISFGCTGGQHRSVYCTEKLANRIRKKYDVSVEVNHTQIHKKDFY